MVHIGAITRRNLRTYEISNVNLVTWGDRHGIDLLCDERMRRMTDDLSRVYSKSIWSHKALDDIVT
jgi:hypothetical protein